MRPVINFSTLGEEFLEFGPGDRNVQRRPGKNNCPHLKAGYWARGSVSGT